MEYRYLGSTGVKVSALCLGTANFGDPTTEEESAQIIHRAVDGGINLIDTGNTYASGKSESIIGGTLAGSNLRLQVLIATKVHYPVGPGPNEQGNSRLHIIQACEDSLRRLKTDYIDIYQVHRPSLHTAVEETMSALTDLVRSGKIRYAGCSTHPGWMVMESISVSRSKGYVKYVCEQPPYNLLDRRIENELLPVCRKYGLGVIPWSPLAMGMLSGRYLSMDSIPKNSRAALRGGIYAERVTAKAIGFGLRFSTLAEEIGMPPSQLAVLWVKDQEGITAPLIGPRSVEQLEKILPVGDMHLNDSVRARCDAIVPPGSAVADFHNSAEWMKMKIL